MFSCRGLALALLVIALPLSPSPLSAAEVDRVATGRGDLVIEPLLHGTIGLEWNDRVIYVDPFGGEAVFAGRPPADVVFITDIHGDHMNPESLAIVVDDETRIVAPQAVFEALPEAMQRKTRVLGNGETLAVGTITVTAVPMYNLPETAASRHPKGRGNGYVLELAGTRVYVSGDTHDIPEMRSLEDIDVAFVCMNPPNTMSVEQAADAVLEFAPRIVYPFHYRSREGLSDVEAFARLVSVNENIEVRLRDWYPER